MTEITTPTPKKKSRLRWLLFRLLKILAWGIGGFIVLFLLITLLLQFPAVQTRIIQKITSSFSERIQTRIEIDRVAVRFPKTVGLKGIFVADEQGDTLLYVGSIFADVGMWGLLRQQVHVNTLEVSNLTANMLREQPDTVYNFQFIIDALGSSPDPQDTISTYNHEDKTPESNWKVRFDHLKLAHIHYRMADHFSGTYLTLHLQKLNTRLKQADILNEKYHAGATFMEGINLHLQIEPPTRLPEPPEEQTSLPMLDIALQELNITDAQFSLNSYDGTRMNVNAASLSLIPESVVLHDFFVGLQKLEADQLHAHFVLPQPHAIEEEFKANEPDNNPFSFSFSEVMDWHIELDQLNLSRSSFALFQGEAQGNPPSSFDPGALQIQNISLEAHNIKVDPGRIMINLTNLSGQFHRDFAIRSFSANIALEGRQSRIDNLRLQTLSSKLHLTLHTQTNLLEINQEALSKARFTLEMGQNHLASDLGWLIPQFNDYYFNWPGNKGVSFGGRINGGMAQLQLDSLWITAPEFFSAYTHAQIKDLANIGSAHFDIQQLRLFAAPKRFFANLPDTLAPQGIELPSYIYIDSKTRGSISDFNSQTVIRSNLGSASLVAGSALTADSLPGWNGTLHIDQLKVGRLIQQPDLLPAPFDVAVDFSGEGNSLAGMAMKVSFLFEGLQIFEHSYEPWQISLSMKDSVASLATQYTDEILNLELNASYGLFAETPSAEAFMVLGYAHLKQLGIMEHDFLVRTRLDSKLVFNTEDFFSGNLNLSNTQIAFEGKIYSLPAFQLSSQAEPSNYHLQLQSPFASADYRGNFSPALLPGILGAHFSHYYDLGIKDTSETDAKRFEFDMQVVPDAFLTEVVLPGLSYSDTLQVNASYNSRDQFLTLEANLPAAGYANLELEEFKLKVISDESQLEMTMDLNRLNFNDIPLRDFVMTGSFANEVFLFQLAFNDHLSQPLYHFGGSLTQQDTLRIFSLDTSPLLINGENWTISQDNQIRLAPPYIEVQNFALQSGSRHLIAQSRQQEELYAIVDLNFKDIDLGRLTEFASGQIPPIGGVFNGSLSLKNIFETPAFLADLTIDNFSFDGDTLGNITLKADNPVQDRYNILATLRSELTNLSINGNYQTGPQPAMQFDVNLQRLDLPTFESFAAGHITHLRGFLSGRMQINGTPDAPLISGNLNINETAFRVPALNAGYFIRGETIRFDRSQLRFQNLALEDSAGRRANLMGSIDITDLNQVGFNLNLNSRNFLLMNVRPGQNEIYHGRILVDTDLRLRGTQNNPTIDGRIKLNEGSGLTLILPQSLPEAIGDDGVVEFVQTRDTLFLQMARQAAPQQVQGPTFDILDLSVNMEIDPQTDVRIIIDRYAGDFVEVKGGGLLSFGIDPGGRITLSGRYEITDGEYLLTFYDFIRRNFRIQPGSHIVWSGDPMQAQVDLTAIFSVRTHARDLLVQQMGTTQGAALRQQFPFQVFLRMRGNLNEPQISFELNLPQEHQNALDGTLMARINQLNQNPSELNKQVFALLMLGHFVQENPLASLGTGGGFESTARSSASQILTQQLNRLSSRYIRGLDINFEVESFVDFADGQEVGRTELQLEVSQNFFDDRVRVTVGGNIELEDETRRNREATDIAGDFSIEYLLTPEGNLRLRGFRTKNYADIFDGQVIETGIALLFSRSYNKFRELFARKEKETQIETDQTETPDQTQNED
ncbi:MAG: translocation/assembly module TamB domain-containing protein [Bacteroidales bacterium]